MNYYEIRILAIIAAESDNHATERTYETVEKLIMEHKSVIHAWTIGDPIQVELDSELNRQGKSNES